MPKTSKPPAPLGASRWVALVVICMAALVLSVDLTVLHLAVPAITEDLNPTSSQILWIADIYGLALASLLITMGNLGDRIGRKKLLLAGSVAFAAASALTAYASSPELLIACRALLGIAGATIYPTTLSIIRNLFTNPKERTAAVGIWTGMISGGMALGPVVGGPLLNNFWWGSVFLINVPVMAILLVVGITVIPESRNPRAGRLDIPSVLTSIIGIMAVVYGIQESIHDGFGQPRILAAVSVAAVSLSAFVWRQTRIADPLIDVRLFRNRAFSGAVSANTIGLFAFIGFSLLLSQYLQLVHGWSPLKAGLALLPPNILAIALSPALGFIVPKVGRARVISMGLALGAVAMLLYTRTDVDSSYVVILIPTLVQALGAMSIFAVTADIIVNSVPKEKSGAGSAIATTAAELGGAVGMAVLGSALNLVYRRSVDLPPGLPEKVAEQAGDNLGAALASSAELPSDQAQQVALAAKQAFMDGMHTAVLASAVLLLIVSVTCLFTLRGLPAEYPDDPEDDDPAALPEQAGPSAQSSSSSLRTEAHPGS
ncbi:DHA2 family efflux MFS transporter permease subunit [Streptomyces sp. NPDC048484]|uniref:DHA2 family efflux MFS transporter permease subunit n=1 Tax=Streptomyces sp. NPDC048484 TaxID=3155146 RepID=UPI00344672EA